MEQNRVPELAPSSSPGSNACARTRTEWDPNEEWDGCCSKSDSHFVKYMAQLGISFTVLALCITMIIINRGERCEVYFSLISGIVGLYSPQPQIKR